MPRQLYRTSSIIFGCCPFPEPWLIIVWLAFFSNFPIDFYDVEPSPPHP